MPKFKIPKIIRTMDVSEYAPEYDGVAIHVWVNPPRGKMEEFDEIRVEMFSAMSELQKITAKKDDMSLEDYKAAIKPVAERNTNANRRLHAWHSEIWSQGIDKEQHWTPEEVEELADIAMEQDPQLWSYVLGRTREMINEYRVGRKKKSKTSS